MRKPYYEYYPDLVYMTYCVLRCPETREDVIVEKVAIDFYLENDCPPAMPTLEHYNTIEIEYCCSCVEEGEWYTGEVNIFQYDIGVDYRMKIWLPSVSIVLCFAKRLKSSLF